MNEKIEPNFYAIIPANVRYDKRLTANQKLLYGEITSLCNQKGYCWATNKYFASLYDVSITSISKWISTLVSFNYLTSEIIKNEKNEITERRIRIFDAKNDNTTNEFNTPIEAGLNTYLTKINDGIEVKLNTPIEAGLKYNNKELNNKNNNKNKSVNTHTRENSEKAFGKGKEQEAVLKTEVVDSIEVVDSRTTSQTVEIVENIEVLEPYFEVETVEVEEVTTNLFGEVVNDRGVRMIEGVVGKKKIKLEDNWVNRFIVENELTEILKMKMPLTNKKLEKIELSYSKESITKKILAMGNYRDLSKKNLDAGLTLSNWLSYENDRNKTKQGTEFKPSAPTVLWAEQMGVEATPEFEKTVDKFVYFGDHSFEALKERKRAMHEGSDIADRI